MDEKKRENGSDRGQGKREGGGPAQFTRVDMSKDGKWIFVDTVTRNFIHVNYMGAILKHNTQASPDEADSKAPVEVESKPSEAVSHKGKRARKADDRTT